MSSSNKKVFTYERFFSREILHIRLTYLVPCEHNSVDRIGDITLYLTINLEIKSTWIPGEALMLTRIDALRRMFLGMPLLLIAAPSFAFFTPT